MILKRILPLLGIMLILAGCFRQAEDSFDTIGSQNSSESEITQEVGVTVEPTDNITVIDPNASPEPSLDAQSVEASSTPRVISPPESDDEEDVSASNTPRALATSNNIPTATEPIFVTPDIVEEVVQPTTTEAPESSEPTLQPTPTAFGEVTVAGDCQYEVQNGDNLFRISINSDVALSALLSANGLTEASVIQPGQILNLPDCDGAGVTAIDDEEPEAEETLLILDDCDYEIQSGDTLFTIAQANEVTLADLLAENDLTENAIIQPGQIVTLPNCIDGDDDVVAPNTSSTIATATVASTTDDDIHTVVAGDTILTIARQYNVTVNSILQANTIPDPNNLTVGQQLVIP